MRAKGTGLQVSGGPAGILWPAMRVLVAPDKFKGTLSAAEAAEAIGRGVRATGASPDLVPMADGGEGTLDALVAAESGTTMGVIARGPLGVPVRAHVGRLPDGTGVVELSQASGLRIVAERDRDPMRASTFGTGEMIRAALARRPSRIIVAIGGSATVDGGMGLARALGVKFLDASGAEVPEGGGGLLTLERIDPGGLDPRVRAVPIIVAADVLSPLLGPDGAARVYGPQKGASPQQVERLEEGLARLARRLREDLSSDAADRPGAGAAGGAGAMLMALGAELRLGAELVLETVGFAARLKAADIVVTGEGKLDRSTGAGKAPIAVARAARAAGVPCAALVGQIEDVPEEFDEVRSLLEYFRDKQQAFDRAAAGLQALAVRVITDRRRPPRQP